MLLVFDCVGFTKFLFYDFDCNGCTVFVDLLFSDVVVLFAQLIVMLGLCCAHNSVDSFFVFLLLLVCFCLIIYCYCWIWIDYLAFCFCCLFVVLLFDCWWFTGLRYVVCLLFWFVLCLDWCFYFFAFEDLVVVALRGCFWIGYYLGFRLNLGFGVGIRQTLLFLYLCGWLLLKWLMSLVFWV